MPLYSIDVEFTFSTTIQLEAADAATAEAIFIGANHDQIAHIHGKSFANVTETVRKVVSTTEIP